MIVHRLATLPFIVILAASCASTPAADRSVDTAVLLAKHEEVLQAHRESSVDKLLAHAQDGFLLVNRGVIARPTAEEQRARLGNYLGRTRFSVYRDQVPPIVNVSADGTLGWVIAQVEARGVQDIGDGTSEPLEFVCAWIELYEKRDGRWVAVGNVSNFKP